MIELKARQEMVLRKCYPRLIVFDLDHTLWPFGVDNFFFKPPYHKNNGKIYDNENKQMVCFPEVPNVLSQLSSDGIQLGVASRTEYPSGAHSLIHLLNWSQYFSYKEIYPGSKVKHFHNFKINSQLNYREMLFFDDEQRNVDDIQPLGVFTVLVDGEVGVTKALVSDAIKKFVDNRSV